MIYLKLFWWALLGRCMGCGGILELHTDGIVGWVGVCTKCGKVDRD